jgi:isopentenyl-diphosphate delta-isomerase type 1
MQEFVVLVNDKNEQIGVMEKLAAHTAYTPLHRAFSVYIFNKKGEFLLTRRAVNKKVFPGIWTNSCCGHPGPGEKTENAIARRMQFELGLTPQNLKVVLPDYRYRAEMNNIVENEICPVYIATVSQNPHSNPDEVSEHKWISWKELLKQIRKFPDKYSPWCKEQVKILENNSLVNID